MTLSHGIHGTHGQAHEITGDRCFLFSQLVPGTMLGD